MPRRAEDPIYGNCVKPSKNRGENESVSVTPVHLKFSFENALAHVQSVTIWNKTRNHLHFRITTPQSDVFHVFCDKFDLYAQSEATVYIRCKPLDSRICVDSVEVQVVGQKAIRIVLELLPTTDWFILPKFVSLPIAPLCTRVEAKINLPLPRGNHVYNFSIVSPLNPIFNVTPRAGAIGGPDGVKFLTISFLANEYMTLTYKLLIKFGRVDCQPYEVDVFGRCAPNFTSAGARRDAVNIEALECELGQGDGADKYNNLSRCKNRGKEPRFRLLPKTQQQQHPDPDDASSMDCNSEEMRKLLSPAGVMKFLMQKDAACKDTSALMLGPLGVEHHKSYAIYSQKKSDYQSALSKNAVQAQGLLCMHHKERLGEDSIANQPELIARLQMDREKAAHMYQKALGMTDNESQDMTRLRPKKFNQRQVRPINQEMHPKYGNDLNRDPSELSQTTFDYDHDAFQRGVHTVKQRVLRPFIHAARVILTRWRVDQRLKKIRKLVALQKEKLKALELERQQEEAFALEKNTPFKCPQDDEDDEEFAWHMAFLKDQLKSKEIKTMIDHIHEKLRNLRGKVNQHVNNMANSVPIQNPEQLQQNLDKLNKSMEEDEIQLRKLKEAEECLEILGMEKSKARQVKDKMVKVKEQVVQLEEKLRAEQEERARIRREQEKEKQRESEFMDKDAEAVRKRQQLDDLVVDELEELLHGSSSLKIKYRQEQEDMREILGDINKAVDRLTQKLNNQHPKIQTLQLDLNQEFLRLLGENFRRFSQRFSNDEYTEKQKQEAQEKEEETIRNFFRSLSTVRKDSLAGPGPGAEPGPINLAKYLRQMSPETLKDHLAEIQQKFDKVPPKFRAPRVLRLEYEIKEEVRKLIEALVEEKEDPTGEKRTLKIALQNINMEVDLLQRNIDNDELDEIQERLNQVVGNLLEKIKTGPDLPPTTIEEKEGSVIPAPVPKPVTIGTKVAEQQKAGDLGGKSEGAADKKSLTSKKPGQDQKEGQGSDSGHVEKKEKDDKGEDQDKSWVEVLPSSRIRDDSLIPQGSSRSADRRKGSIIPEALKGHQAKINREFKAVPGRFKTTEVSGVQKDINDLIDKLLVSAPETSGKGSKGSKGSFHQSLGNFKSQFGSEIKDLQQSIIEGIKKSLEDPNLMKDKKTLSQLEQQLKELENATEAQVEELKEEHDKVVEEVGKQRLTRIHSKIDKLQDILAGSGVTSNNNSNPELSILQGSLHKEFLQILNLPPDAAAFGYDPKERESATTSALKGQGQARGQSQNQSRNQSLGHTQSISLGQSQGQIQSQSRGQIQGQSKKKSSVSSTRKGSQVNEPPTLDPEKLTGHLKSINQEFDLLPEKFLNPPVIAIKNEINRLVEDLIRVNSDTQDENKDQGKVKRKIKASVTFDLENAKDREELHALLKKVNSEVENFQEKVQDEKTGKHQSIFLNEFNKILQVPDKDPKYLRRKPVPPARASNKVSVPSKELKDLQDKVNEAIAGIPEPFVDNPALVQLQQAINEYANKELLGIENPPKDPSEKEELIKILQNINEKVDSVAGKVHSASISPEQDSFNNAFKKILQLTEDHPQSHLLQRKASLKALNVGGGAPDPSKNKPSGITADMAVKLLKEFDKAFDALPKDYANHPTAVALRKSVKASLRPFIDKIGPQNINDPANLEKKLDLINKLNKVNSEVNRLQEFLADPAIGQLHELVNNDYNKMLSLNSKDHPSTHLKRKSLTQKTPQFIPSKDLETLRKNIVEAMNQIPKVFLTDLLVKLRDAINIAVESKKDADINNYPQKKLALIDLLRKINGEIDSLQEKLINNQVHSLQNQMNGECNHLLNLENNDDFKLSGKPLTSGNDLLKMTSKELELSKKTINDLIDQIPPTYRTPIVQKIQAVINDLLDPLIEQLSRSEMIEHKEGKNKLKEHLEEVNQLLVEVQDKVKIHIGQPSGERLEGHRKDLNKEYFHRFGDFLSSTGTKKHTMAMRRVKLGESHRLTLPSSTIEELKEYRDKINEEFGQIPPEEMSPNLQKTHKDINRTMGKLLKELAKNHGMKISPQSTPSNESLVDLEALLNLQNERNDLKRHIERINWAINMLQNLIQNPELEDHRTFLNNEFERLLDEKLDSRLKDGMKRKNFDKKFQDQLERALGLPDLQRHMEKINHEFITIPANYQTPVVKKAHVDILGLITALRNKKLGLNNVDGYLTNGDLDLERDLKLLRKQKEKINTTIDRLQSRIKHVEIAKFQVYLNHEINRLLKGFEDPSKEGANTDTDTDADSETSKYFIGASTRKNTNEIVQTVTLEELKYHVESIGREINKIPERFMTDYIRKLRDGINDAIEELKKRIIIENANSPEGRMKNAVHELSNKFKGVVASLQGRIVEGANTFDLHDNNNCDVIKMYKEPLGKEAEQLRDLIKYEVDRLRAKLRRDREVTNKMLVLQSINQLDDSARADIGNLQDIIDSLAGDLQGKIKSIKMQEVFEKYNKKWWFRKTAGTGGRARWLTAKKKFMTCGIGSSGLANTCPSSGNGLRKNSPKVTSGRFYDRSRRPSRYPTNVELTKSEMESAYDFTGDVPTTTAASSSSFTRVTKSKKTRGKRPLGASQDKEAKCEIRHPVIHKSEAEMLKELEEIEKNL